MVIKKKSLDKKMLFYIGLLALPLLQFCVFYIYVNFKFIILAFQEYDVQNFTYEFVGLSNFTTVFDKVFVSEGTAFAIRLKNSSGTSRDPITKQYWTKRTNLSISTFQNILQSYCN